jgi:type IV pilus assembly protein PilE
MKTQRGFTLIELMIALVVVAILTAIALPSYTKYITRGKIPDATANLATKRVQMEQWYQDNHTYGANTAGVAAPACVADTTTSPKNFNFSCVISAAGDTYVLTATGKGPMLGFSYTIDQNNNKGSAFTAAPAGWIAATPNNCWVTNVGGSC